MTVALRSAACGFSHGLLVSLGIVTGAVLFIVFAIYGLALLADWLGGQFMLVKLPGGAYLLWLGIVLLRAKMRVEETDREFGSSLMSSFLAGLFISLGDRARRLLRHSSIYRALNALAGLTLIGVGITLITRV